MAWFKKKKPVIFHCSLAEIDIQAMGVQATGV
jgi:hypothetical protein